MVDPRFIGVKGRPLIAKMQTHFRTMGVMLLP